MLTLYDYFRSSACFRVRIALQLKKQAHHLASVHLLNQGGEQHFSQYKKINPHALIPSLQTDVGVITQSLAIIEWLEETYPTPSLFPKNPYEKALARSFALSIACDIHPLNNLRVRNYLTQLALTEEQKQTWYCHWIENGLQALELQLQNWQLHGRFCFADEPTIADICLIPQLYNAKRINCDVSQLVHINRIAQACENHPAFINAWPQDK